MLVVTQTIRFGNDDLEIHSYVSSFSARDFKTFLESLARLSRLSRLLLNKLFLVKLMTRGKGGGQKS